MSTHRRTRTSMPCHHHSFCLYSYNKIVHADTLESHYSSSHSLLSCTCHQILFHSWSKWTAHHCWRMDGNHQTDRMWFVCCSLFLFPISQRRFLVETRQLQLSSSFRRTYLHLASPRISSKRAVRTCCVSDLIVFHSDDLETDRYNVKITHNEECILSNQVRQRGKERGDVTVL